MSREKFLTLLSANESPPTSRSGFLLLLAQNRFPVLLALVGLIFILVGIFAISQESNGDGVILDESVSTTGEVSSDKIRVDVSGSVLHPGVYQLKSDARIQEALIEAGGLAEDADRAYISKNINLAAKISDGAKIYVPRVGEIISANKTTASLVGTVAGDVSGLININTATVAELDPLPGIGPKTAQKIIDGRPYSSVEELLDKKIVGSKVFSDIKEKVTAF